MEKNLRVSNIPIKSRVDANLWWGDDDCAIRTTLSRCRRYFNWSDTFRGTLFANLLKEAKYRADSQRIIKMTTREELDYCYDFVLDLTMESGKVIRDAFQGSKKIETKSGDWDLVTQYDRKIEEILIDSLAKRFPTHK